MNISQLQLNDWEDEDKAPERANTIIDLVNQVKKIAKGDSNSGSIVVQCL